MPNVLINKEKFYKKRVFYGILDWGLGHTTRSIPLIRFLQELGFEVVIACNSTQQKVLSAELENARFLPLKGYALEYGNSSWHTKLKIGLQSLNILTNIKSENGWIRAQMALEKPDLIISDNRYGFRNDSIPSVLITHQLQVRTGLGVMADLIMKQFLRSQFKHFNSCWVPDIKNAPGLAGELSHPAFQFPRPVSYLGLVSRLERPRIDNSDGPVVVILSGPEPQRTVLEHRIIEGLKATTRPIVIVRGKPDGGSLPLLPENVEVYNHLPATQLSVLVAKASYVISRSGYTTLMDMFKLGKKLIAIPTPGQAEQEYLGKILHKERRLLCIDQQTFDIGTAIVQAEAFEFKTWEEASFDLYKSVISEQLNLLLK